MYASTYYTRSVFGFASLFAAHSGENVIYQVDGMDYEGYWSEATAIKPSSTFNTRLGCGLTDYEKKRSEMLNELGYNVFHIDLFGKDIRPTEVKDKKQHTGELYKDWKCAHYLMQAQWSAKAWR